MTNIIYWLLIMIATVMLMVYAFMGYETIKENKARACGQKVQMGYQYMQRKLCDPNSTAACFIRHEDQIELDQWYVQSLLDCTK